MESTIHKTLITYVDAFIKFQLKISVCFFQQEKGKSFYFCVFFFNLYKYSIIQILLAGLQQ